MPRITSLIPFLALLSPLTAAAPVNKQSRSACNGTTTLWDAKTLLQIAPAAASCNGAPYPDECRTAEQAAPHIAQSFSDYKVTNEFEQAALVSIMLFESGNFVYNKNHFPAPGTPGKGTRNMQSPAYNLLYARDVIPAEQLTPVENDPASVLEFLLVDEFSFVSAAWFLTTQCTDTVRAGLKQGTLDGWHAYLTDCIVTTVTDDRDAGWQKAIAQIKN